MAYLGRPLLNHRSVTQIWGRFSYLMFENFVGTTVNPEIRARLIKHIRRRLVRVLYSQSV